jgi:hypothetical protein
MRVASLVLIFAGVAALAGFLAFRAEEAAPGPRPSPLPTAIAADVSAPPTETAPSTEERDAVLAAYEAELAFGEEAKAFLDRAEAMTTRERAERAEALAARAKAREEAGQLVPGQSRFLRAALYAAAYADDPSTLRARTDALQAEKEAAEAKAAPPDPRLALYKAREREVLEEVMAMSSYPGGMSRGDYLRERLDEVREEVWSAE